MPSLSNVAARGPAQQSRAHATADDATNPSCRLQVPIPLYLMTHAYFCFYHAVSNVALRVTRHLTAERRPVVQHLTTALTVFLLAYATACMETLTIAHFPYYKFKVEYLP